MSKPVDQKIRWSGLCMAGTSLALIGFVAAYSVGGPNLVLLLSSAALVAQVAARKGVDPLTSLLSGLALAISWVFIVGALVVPCLKLLPGADVALFQTTKLRGASVAGEFFYDSFQETKRIVSVLLAALPVFVLLWREIRVRRASGRLLKNYFTSGTHTSGLTTALAVMITPVVLASMRKARHPYEFLASTMSGDGRNFFLTVENIRLTSNPTRITSLAGQGNFFPSLASHLSIGMGANGRFDVRDQYAIAAVYVLAACLMFLAIATYVVRVRANHTLGNDLASAQRGRMGAFCPMFLIVGLVVTTFGPVMNMTFRGGFFSLYGAMAFVGAYLAVSVGTSSAWRLPVQIAVLVLLIGTYPLGLGVLVLPMFRDGGKQVWGLARIHRRWAGLIALVTIVAGAISLSDVLQRIQDKAVADGWIIPIDNGALLPILIVAAISLLIVRRKSSSRLFADVLLVVLSGTFTNFILQTQRERAGLSGTGYYGEKNDFIIYFSVVFLTLAGLLVFAMIAVTHLESRLWKSACSRISGIAFATALFACVVWAATTFFESSQTLLKRADRWQQPTANSAEFAIGNWNTNDLVFFDPENLSEGRIVDFWLPYFWQPPGYMWVYNEFSVEPTKICSLLGQQPARVETPDKGLKQQIVSTCGQYVLLDEKTK